ncbi:MAG: hypothetical protein ACK5MF_02050 [Vibrio sp.]|uniref:hypothetical protein n=1 Tax=Vibrio sp. TaxID=678 RepID=UPI003A88615E
MNSEQVVDLGRATICDDCLESIQEYSIYQNEYLKRYELLKILFNAEMSLRIFRKSFPESSKTAGFNLTLRCLKKIIDDLDKKIMQLPDDINILSPLNKTINELRVLYELYR